MNNMTLMPYSLYILYAAIALLIICSIITILHLNRLMHCLQKEQPDIDQIKKGLEQAKIKAAACKTKSDSDIAKAKQSIPALLLLMAIHQNYRQNRKEGKRGIRSMNQAAAAAVQKRAVQQQVSSVLRSTLGSGVHF